MIGTVARALALILVTVRWSLADRDDPVLAAVWVVAALLVGTLLLRAAAPRLRSLPVLLPATGLALWALLSTLWSEDPGTTLGSALSLLAACALAMGLAGLPDAWRGRVAWSLVLGAALASAVALRQVLSGFPALREAIAAGEVLVEPRVVRTALAGRAFGTFFAPDMLAGGLIIALPVACTLVAAQRGSRRALAMACAALIAVALPATRSVGGAAALLCAGIAVLVLWLWRRAPRGPLLAGTAVVLLLLGVMAASRWQGAAARAQERWINQRTAFVAMADAPLLGHGHDSYGIAAPPLQQPGVAMTRYAHGLLGQSASDGGVPGLLLALAVLLGAGLQAGRLLRDPSAGLLERGAAVGLVAGAVHAAIDYDLLFGENQVALWCAAAMASAQTPRILGPRPRAVLTTLAVLAVALGLWRTSGLLRGSLAVRASSCREAAGELEAAGRTFFIDAELARSAAIRLHGCAEAGADRHARAVTWMERALARRPRDAILRAELGLSLAMAGRPDEAWPQFVQAQAAWPGEARVHALEAQAALVVGDHDRAAAALERAQRRSPEDPVVQRLQRVLQPASVPTSQVAP